MKHPIFLFFISLKKNRAASNLLEAAPLGHRAYTILIKTFSCSYDNCVCNTCSQCRKRSAVLWLSFISSRGNPTKTSSIMAAEEENVYSWGSTLFPTNRHPASFNSLYNNPTASQNVSLYDSESPHPNKATFFPVKSHFFNVFTPLYK